MAPQPGPGCASLPHDVITISAKITLPDILVAMAARAGFIEGNAAYREVVDLRKISVSSLEPLLEDEIREWRHELDWDFAPTAALVRKFAATNSLGGAALLAGGKVAGYGYAVVEEPRGIIGDIYLRPAYRDPAAEVELFRALLDALASTPNITRMESQLMLATAQSADAIQKTVQVRGRPINLFKRLLMSRDTGAPLGAANPGIRPIVRFEAWQHRFLHAAGGIIAAAYKGETDSAINSQYRTPSGARLFLNNIVDFPGCGNFHAPSSYMAFEAATNEPVGLVLTSIVLQEGSAAEVGHIAQLCVVPRARGSGIGRELLRMACDGLVSTGARRITLTVTASNAAAISLYGNAAFRAVRSFFAYAWEA